MTTLSVPAEVEAPPTVWKDLVTLGKPGITMMCVLMAAGGYGLALRQAEAGPNTGGFLLSLVATALSVMGANAMNMVLEREGDRAMVRTRNRPLPSGRMHPGIALAFGVIGGVVSFGLFYEFVNPVAAWLSAFAYLSYVFVYTPLKRRTPQALAIGAVPGAMPPLLGWACVTGEINAPGVVLFLILLLWQLPHFLAISLYRLRDYAAAGILTVPVVRGEEQARIQSMAYTVLLVPVSLMLVPLGVAGFLYFVVASALGAWFFVYSVLGFEPGAGPVWARRFFFASLIYLPVLTGALILDVYLG
jgi:protoheme IX farnesyltransferase